MKNKRFHIIFFSTFFAILLWASIIMTYDYQSFESVPLVLENMKPTRALAQPIPERVSIKVRGTGWQLITLSFSPDKKYVLDVSGISNRYSFLTNQDVMERFAVPQGIRVVEVQPETVAVILDEKISKKVRLLPTTTLDFRDGYDIVGEMKLVPDSVEITGARSRIDRIEEWPTAMAQLSELRSAVNVQVAIPDSPQVGITVFPHSASLQFDVQLTAEKIFKGITVSLNDVPENRAVVLLPPKIDITIRGGVDQVARIDQHTVSAYVDYRTILLDTTGAVQPTIVYPKDVKIIGISPPKVQYVIRK
jgi:YbbR domain-containing protein